MFGLPDGVTACLFDMDGVVTQTAVVHAAAWKEMFDEFLRKYAESTGTEFVPFDPHAEYDAYVDGKPRLDGTRSFLESRGIHLPEGTPDDPPGTPTLYGLSNRKNDLVLAKIAAGGVQVYDGSIAYIQRGAGRGDLHRDRLGERQYPAGAEVRGHRGPVRRPDGRGGGQGAGLARKAGAGHLPGRRRGAERARGRAVVFEDAQAGVAAGHAGHFALVVGVDRVGQAAELREHGADIVVKDLAELLDHGRPGKDADDQAVRVRDRALAAGREET